MVIGFLSCCQVSWKTRCQSSLCPNEGSCAFGVAAGTVFLLFLQSYGDSSCPYTSGFLWSAWPTRDACMLLMMPHLRKQCFRALTSLSSVGHNLLTITASLCLTIDPVLKRAPLLTRWFSFRFSAALEHCGNLRTEPFPVGLHSICTCNRNCFIWTHF